jgi:hypothetical protein
MSMSAANRGGVFCTRAGHALLPACTSVSLWPPADMTYLRHEMFECGGCTDPRVNWDCENYLLQWKLAFGETPPARALCRVPCWQAPAAS